MIPENKTPVLGELLEMVRSLQGQVASLQGKKAEDVVAPPKIKTSDEAPKDGEMGLPEFLKLHWSKQVKALKAGTADGLLVAITQSEEVGKKVKEEALLRFEATKEKTDG